jgi:hypothetical protein
LTCHTQHRYLENGKFDLAAYDRLLDMQVANGVDGVIVGGTTGEQRERERDAPRGSSSSSSSTGQRRQQQQEHVCVVWKQQREPASQLPDLTRALFCHCCCCCCVRSGEGHLMSWDEHIMLIAHTVNVYGDRLKV